MELLGTKVKAMEHAKWALRSVSKPCTIRFWYSVIEALKKEPEDPII
jgi:hypothetical protein